MGEPDAIPFGLDHSRRDGPFEIPGSTLAMAQGPLDQCHRRLGKRRGGEQDILGPRRQSVQAVLDQPPEVVRDREGLCRPGVRISSEQGSGELKGEEGVASRRPVEPHQTGTGERGAQPGPYELVQGGQAERTDPNPVEPPLQHGPVETERNRNLRLVLNSHGREDSDRLGLQAANGELEHPGRGRIEPLHVVHGNDHRPRLREGSKRAQGRHRDRPRVRWSAFGQHPKECHLKRPALGFGKGRGHLVQTLVQ